MSETVSFPDLSASVDLPDLAQSATFPNLDETVNFPSLDLSVTIPVFDWTARLDGGAYAMTGTDVQILFGLNMVAAAGSYAITGTALTPLRSLVMAANAGSYAVSGTDIEFGLGAATGFGSGSYVLTGTEVSLNRQLVMASGAGAYSTTGTDLAFQRDLSVSLGAGSFAITGTNAALEVGTRAALDAGSYAISGTAAQFARALVVSLTPGSFAITGTAAGLRKASKLAMASGSYTISGTDATLTHVAGITLVGTSNAIASAGTGSASHTLPSGLAENDVVIVMGIRDDGTEPATPSGWTSIFNTASQVRTRVIYKKMGSSPDTSVVMTDAFQIVSMAFRGVNTTTQLDVAATNANGGTGVPNNPSITPVTNGAAIVLCAALDDDIVSDANITAPTGYGDKITDSGNDTSTAAMAWKLQTTAAAEDPSAWTMTGGNDAWEAVTIALRPA